MGSTVSYIHTLGGSTLDNLSAMLTHSNPTQHSIKGHLQTLVGDQYKVVSYACERMTTSDILEAQHLEPLQRDITTHPQSTHYVIISAGSDECGRVFEGRGSLRDIQAISARYLRIVDAVKSQSQYVKPILVLEPLPHLSDAAKAKLTRFGRVVVALHVLFFAAVPITATFIAMKVSLVFAAVYASVYLLTTFMAVNRCSSQRFRFLFIVKEACMGKDLAMAVLKIFMRSFYQPILTKARQDRLPVSDLTNNPLPAPPAAQRSAEEQGERTATVLAHIINACDNDNVDRIHRYQPRLSHNAPTVTMTNIDPHEWEIGMDTPWDQAVLDW